MFELLNDPLTATFAVNEITRLLSSKPKSSSEGDDSDEEKLHQLCQRYLRYIETFNGNEEEERFGVLLSFLRGIEEVCLTAPWRRELFSEKGLFTGLMTLLTFQTPRHPERKATIVDECLRIIYYFDEATFEAAIGYAHLKVVLFSFIDYLDQRGIVDRLFENALKTKRKEHWETLAIRYPRFLHIACELLPLMRDEAAVLSVLERLQGLFATLSNVATCCDAGTLGVILDTFEGLARRSENSTGAAAAAATATATATKPTTSHSGASSAANGTIKRLADIAQTLGSYSLSAGDLSHFFRLMSLAATSIITTTTASSSSSSSSEQNKGKGEEGKVGYHRHPQFPYLVRCLHGIASSNIGGPSAYYVFNGTTSHILLPRLERWPFQKGMTFCAWVRIETSEAPTTSTDNNNNNNNNNSSSSSSSNSSSHVDNGRRHICYFADDGASGEENAFDIFISAGGQLVLETTYFGVKEVYGCCSPDSQLPRGKWFFLTMTIAPSTMIPMSGEVKAFINAAQICKVSIRYPKLDMAKYGAIGCRLPAVSPLGFYGQLGAIHFFEDILSSSQILDIYRNGANYTGSFTALE